MKIRRVATESLGFGIRGGKRMKITGDCRTKILILRHFTQLRSSNCSDVINYVARKNKHDICS